MGLGASPLRAFLSGDEKATNTPFRGRWEVGGGPLGLQMGPELP